MATALETVRTYAFHDLTTLTGQFSNWPSLSGDGKVVAFATTAANPSRILVNTVNADGSGQKQIDSFEPLCYCDGRLDISADGSTVVAMDSVQIRAVHNGAAVPVVTLTSNEIWDLRVTGDGSKVFFLLRRDAALKTSGMPLQRGVYVVGTDGNGLKQITGPTAVGGLIGMTPDKVFPFAACGPSLDISSDGSRVVFASEAAGAQSVFAVGGDGGGLHKLVDAAGGFKNVNKVGLSGNGQLAGYHATVGDNMIELGVIGFDGSGRRKLGSEPPAQLGGCTGRLQLSSDASKMYVAEPGYLYNTDGSGVLQLASVSNAFRPPNGAPLQDGTPSGTSNATATRFAFRRGDDKGIGQVMLLELDPMSLGAAPTLGSPTFTPVPVTIKGLDKAMATVKATGAKQVGSVFYSDGLPDLLDRGDGTGMHDDGKKGDATAGDGVYTGQGFYGYYPPKPGPKSLRFTAETTGPGLRHATVLETRGVVLQP
jgi:Tol biopolymer transport system component